MLTTQNSNPMNTFNFQYYTQLRSISHEQAEEYRQKVTAPKPGSIRMEDLSVNASSSKNEDLEIPVIDIPAAEENVEESIETTDEKVILKKRGRPFAKKK